MKPILKITSLVLLIGILSPLSCKKEYSCEGCINGNGNKPPIANAGPDQAITLPTDSVSLDGTASGDPDGTINSYLWTKISGPVSLTTNNAAAVTTIAKNLAAGVYQFELKVTDNGGLSAKDTMRVIVNDPVQPNRPPVAHAGADQLMVMPANAILLNGSSSSDPDNNITGYSWTKIAGPPSFNITNANVVQTQVTNLVQGIYQFELKVTDAGGLFSKDTMQVTVNASPVQPPDANAGPDIIITLPLDSVYLFGVSTSMLPVTFQWTIISGPPGASITNVAMYTGAILVKNLIPGLYSFRLQVTEATGMLSADTTHVLVINDPQDLNTITFKNLKWRLVDEYGTGIIDLNIETPGQPNLFIAWDQHRPIEVYLQTDSASQFFIVPSTPPGLIYSYDAASPVIWIARIPRDDSWVGKQSSVKIRLL